ncbi:MAG: ABC transporter substrate-binding protein [Ruminococcaceae bacterium]|nr:ABC transporter substrate-binding protein [Oscillospiraceae bacterium]
MKKQLTAFFLSALLTLSGCGQELPDTPPEDLTVDDTITEQETVPAIVTLPERFALPYDPAVTLDPLTCPDGPHQVIGALLYEGLFMLDTSMQPQKLLCAAYSCDESKTTWTFQLREDARFSDGSPLTAADTAASLDRARETARYRARLSHVDMIVHDGSTITVTLLSPNAAFPALLDIPITKAGTESRLVPLGTAPYFFSESEGGAVLLPSEYRHSTLPAECIYLSPCSGATALHHQFSSHQIQLISTDLTAQSTYVPSGSVDLTDADTTVLQFIGFNIGNPLFSSAELRNALGFGIDRQTLVSAHLAGHALPAQSPISPCSPLYPASLDTVYSKEAFLDAMANAGYRTGTPREITLLVNTDNRHKVSAAHYIADMLSLCDIKITVSALPWGEYIAALESGAFDLYYGEVRLTADWDLSPLVGTGGSMNYGGYSDNGMDFLLARSANSEKRETSMRQLCRYLQANAPILPLCFKRTTVLSEAGVAEHLMPTASNPFYSMNTLHINLLKSTAK